MPRYRWTGAGTFEDRGNDRDVDPGDVVELDEAVAGPWAEFVPADESDDADAESESDDDADDLTDLDGVGESKAEALREAGFESAAGVQDADPEALADVDGISDGLADDLAGE